MWKSWIHNCMLKWAFKALQYSQSFKIRSIHKCLRKANIRKSLITSYLRAWTETWSSGRWPCLYTSKYSGKKKVFLLEGERWRIIISISIFPTESFSPSSMLLIIVFQTAKRLVFFLYPFSIRKTFSLQSLRKTSWIKPVDFMGI